jgi:hypothetical protein
MKLLTLVYETKIKSKNIKITNNKYQIKKLIHQLDSLNQQYTVIRFGLGMKN